jgi:hypothetical protein
MGNTFDFVVLISHQLNASNSYVTERPLSKLFVFLMPSIPNNNGIRGTRQLIDVLEFLLLSFVIAPAHFKLQTTDVFLSEAEE